MEESKRIRLVFKDDDILSEAQKADGLNRSWVLLKPQQHDTVSDVASHLLHAFHLQESCPHGLLLSISGFVLPPFESTRILKDDEIIRIRKRRDILAIAGNDAAKEIQNLKALEKQPVNSGVLLLANEEFEKENGGYESDDLEEESGEHDEVVVLEDKENPKDGNADLKNRKRKAAEKLLGSKKKKHRSQATGNVANEIHTEIVDAEDHVENNEGNAKLSDNSPATGIKR
ncbi:hypothetical protein CDL12_04338 [Handroanthus impetiginosus]|uniref:Coilin N-terminal domain-containing protein n=1 Tax=Handroanthus impetiginosus TaxID=429701 RepID=A0A2G9HZK6_9LAMI|nr:hypothetical protein CDL12_04338 [Handroanthus impetiginosus]